MLDLCVGLRPKGLFCSNLACETPRFSRFILSRITWSTCNDVTSCTAELFRIKLADRIFIVECEDLCCRYSHSKSYYIFVQRHEVDKVPGNVAAVPMLP